jgi:hypothetical protein
MKRDDLPFQRHWIYYLVLKYAVIAAAVVVTLYTVIVSIRAEARSETRGSETMARQTFLGMRTHHLAIALIAILVAVALASNYYLW